jgi:hypothetical protein
MRQIFTFLLLVVSTSVFGQLPEFEWVEFNDNSRGLDVLETGLGNVYSVGRRGSGDTQDGFIRKFQGDGTLIWEVQVGSFGFGQDGAAEAQFAIDGPDESIYVLGTFEGTVDFDFSDDDVEVTSQGSDDVFIVKYSSDGDYEWHVTYGGPLTDFARGLTINSQDELVIAGSYSGTVDFDPGPGEFLSTPDGTTSSFLLKLTTDAGFVDFVDINEEDDDGSMSARRITVDDEDNIYMVGRFSGEVDFDFDDSSEFLIENTSITSSTAGFALKLTNEFDFLWARGLLSTGFEIYGLGVSTGNSLVLTGMFNLNDLDLSDGTNVETLYENEEGLVTYYILKFDSSGSVDWTEVFTYESGSNTSIISSDLTVDVFGDIYITGAFRGSFDLNSSDPDFILGSSFGERNTYVHKLNTEDGSFSHAFAAVNAAIILGGGIHIGETGDLYVNGGFDFSSQTGDFDPSEADSETPYEGGDSYLWKLKECFPVFAEIEVAQCETYTVPSGDETYTITGIYQDTLVTALGCDSILTIDLTILENTTSTVVESACESFTWDLTGTTYTESGEFETTIPNAAGCDSLINLDLTINNVFDITETESACESFVWEVTGETLTESNTYVEEFTTAQGCDSTRTLVLTILEESSSTIEVSACDEYEVPSGEETYTASGTYQDVILNEAGCDSLITIELEINQSSMGTMITAEECFSYTSPSGQEYTESGEFTEVFVNAVGCDSIIPLSIVINNVDATLTNTDNILEANEEGATYQWLDCNDNFVPITDGTGQVFEPTENGSYAVQVSNAFCTDTSDCEVIFNLSVVTNGFDQKIGLYPNPSAVEVLLSLEQPLLDAEVRIYTIAGELVGSYRGVLNHASILPFDEGLKGTFIVEVISEGKKAVLRATRL